MNIQIQIRLFRFNNNRSRLQPISEEAHFFFTFPLILVQIPLILLQHS